MAILFGLQYIFHLQFVIFGQINTMLTRSQTYSSFRVPNMTNKYDNESLNTKAQHNCKFAF